MDFDAAYAQVVRSETALPEHVPGVLRVSVNSFGYGKEGARQTVVLDY